MSNAYKSGDAGFLPLFQNTPEITTPVELNVTGTIPNWISGALFRVGPGTYEVQLTEGKKYRGGDVYKVDHWFDGISQAHSFRIKEGKVSYRSKNIAEEFKQKIVENGEEVKATTFAQKIPHSTIKNISRVIGNFMTSSEAKRSDKIYGANNVGVTITPNFPIPKDFKNPLSSNLPKDEIISISMPETLVTKTDANFLKELDPVTLESRRTFNYSDITEGIAGDGPFSGAHSQYDPESNEYFNYTAFPGASFKHNVFSVPANYSDSPRLLASSTTWTAA
ncbi:hypothetical protein HK096_010965, partial [Nowakowskiella sp. JEL0078]